MAMAGKLLAGNSKAGPRYRQPSTYVSTGDGCMMEGISHKPVRLAGTWGLGKMIAFWTTTTSPIDGHVDG